MRGPNSMHAHNVVKHHTPESLVISCEKTWRDLRARLRQICPPHPGNPDDVAHGFAQNEVQLLTEKVLNSANKEIEASARIDAIHRDKLSRMQAAKATRLVGTVADATAALQVTVHHAEMGMKWNPVAPERERVLKRQRQEATSELTRIVRSRIGPEASDIIAQNHVVRVEACTAMLLAVGKQASSTIPAEPVPRSGPREGDRPWRKWDRERKRAKLLSQEIQALYKMYIATKLALRRIKSMDRRPELTSKNARDKPLEVHKTNEEKLGQVQSSSKKRKKQTLRKNEDLTRKATSKRKGGLRPTATPQAWMAPNSPEVGAATIGNHVASELESTIKSIETEAFEARKKRALLPRRTIKVRTQRERVAAINIQRVARGKLVRASMRAKKVAAVRIQSAWRGKSARLLYAVKLSQEIEVEEIRGPDGKMYLVDKMSGMVFPGDAEEVDPNDPTSTVGRWVNGAIELHAEFADIEAEEEIGPDGKRYLVDKRSCIVYLDTQVGEEEEEADAQVVDFLMWDSSSNHIVKKNNGGASLADIDFARNAFTHEKLVSEHATAQARAEEELRVLKSKRFKRKETLNKIVLKEEEMKQAKAAYMEAKERFANLNQVAQKQAKTGLFAQMAFGAEAFDRVTVNVPASVSLDDPGTYGMILGDGFEGTGLVVVGFKPYGPLKLSGPIQTNGSVRVGMSIIGVEPVTGMTGWDEEGIGAGAGHIVLMKSDAARAILKELAHNRKKITFAEVTPQIRMQMRFQCAAVVQRNFRRSIQARRAREQAEKEILLSKARAAKNIAMKKKEASRVAAANSVKASKLLKRAREVGESEVVIAKLQFARERAKADADRAKLEAKEANVAAEAHQKAAGAAAEAYRAEQVAKGLLLQYKKGMTGIDSGKKVKALKKATQKAMKAAEKAKRDAKKAALAAENHTRVHAETELRHKEEAVVDRKEAHERAKVLKPKTDENVKGNEKLNGMKKVKVTNGVADFSMAETPGTVAKQHGERQEDFIAGEATRIAPTDQRRYNKAGFESYYGGTAEWDAAEATEEVRTATRVATADGKRYNKAEFMSYYGGTTEWDAAVETESYERENASDSRDKKIPVHSEVHKAKVKAGKIVASGIVRLSESERRAGVGAGSGGKLALSKMHTNLTDSEEEKEQDEEWEEDDDDKSFGSKSTNPAVTVAEWESFKPPTNPPMKDRIVAAISEHPLGKLTEATPQYRQRLMAPQNSNVKFLDDSLDNGTTSLGAPPESSGDESYSGENVTLRA
jgi:hypothetical protein